MPAPTESDGIGRAVWELAAPSVGVIMAVAFTKEFLGPVMAGLLYLFLTGIILLGIYTSARHWNIRYTAGFVFSGFILLAITPSIVSQLVHPIFGFLGTLLIIGFLIGMVLLFIDKAGLDELLN